MRRWLGWIAIGWLLLLCVVALLAYGSTSHAATLDERTREVALQLRCPVCQGESVADSSAPISADMRASIRQQLRAGRSPDQIKHYFVSRYGNWILLSPPSSGLGGLAWLAPPLLLLGGLGLLATLIADWRRGGAAPVAADDPYLARIRAELAAGEE